MPEFGFNTWNSSVLAVGLAFIADSASKCLVVNHYNHVLLKHNASHSAAVLVGCTMLKKAHEVVHTGLLKLLVHHGGHMT